MMEGSKKKLVELFFPFVPCESDWMFMKWRL